MPSRYSGTMAQDCDTVVLRKARPKAQDPRDPNAVNQALRSGLQVQTVKKFDAGTNRNPPETVVSSRKLDEAEEPAALGRVATEVRLAIQKARSERKMSQAELAKQISESTRLVQEYENGKAVLAKMEKVLGVKLRGKINK
ncbi:multiprotein-bridging factor 1c [Actinidia eriantha]|uniref:multiprotein-bridging factor 1c n=1 Tax=Actinidia eriantha TaxID=165200 RepID=UPI002588A130|nr:multiprotein-bridging factor 1c [Actinidia eriantha]